MTEKIIIAGAGGQGIMLMGKVLAEAAMRENKYVTWLPSYGAEVRGGTAHCMVVISDEPIGSPCIGKADTLIIMNGPSLIKFKDRINHGGLLLINSSLINTDILTQINANLTQIAADKSAGTCAFPFTDIAIKLGNIKVANMVALGAYLARKKIAGIKSVLAVIEKIAPAEKKGLIAINKQAISSGAALIKGE